jgi:CxxC motif-containing protein (DUF1111 family)
VVSRSLIWLVVVASTATAAVADVRDKDVDAAAGKALFQRNWIGAPASNGNAGLGPIYDARSCSSCHNGGGPGAVALDAIGAGFVARIGGRAGRTDPVYGQQLQQSALPTVPVEATLRLRAEARDGLRNFTVEASRWGYGAPAPNSNIGLRRAPSLHGVGLLEAISDSDLIAMAKSRRAMGSKGRIVWLRDVGGRLRPGRWGWKAETVDLGAQIDTALHFDLGLSTKSYPPPWGDCTFRQARCRALAIATHDKARAEAGAVQRSLILSYVRSLDAPDRAPPMDRGGHLFVRIGCGLCHADLPGHGAPGSALTDLLLHDMGPGLDDHVGAGNARSYEWRTAPLWNVSAELARGGLLHDGRARSVEEAVRWHGGEASLSRERFAQLSSADRKAIVAFLLGHS